MIRKLLHQDKENCCGCSACAVVCPKCAIQMKEDEHGFLYPYVTPELCIDCGKCNNVCSFHDAIRKSEFKDCYAAVTSSTDLMKSSSGGVFAALAKAMLSLSPDNATVFGAKLEKSTDEFVLRHVEIQKSDEIECLLGSKYAQSDITSCFLSVKNNLVNGGRVLFSGTPCECGALRRYLSCDYENLILVDIVCHGTPNMRLFNDYVHLLEMKQGSPMLSFLFRDKKCGWQYKTAKAVFENGQTKKIFSSESSYLNLFEKGLICRPSCGACKYSSSERVGDITIGDFWGVSDNVLTSLSIEGCINLVERGVSCVSVNSEKGKYFLEQASSFLKLSPVSFEQISRNNVRLTDAGKRKTISDKYLKLYETSGYDTVEREWKNARTTIYWVQCLKNRVPIGMKKLLRKL